MEIKQIFGNNRIIGFAGDKNTGKSNNLVALIINFRKYNETTPIYTYGFKKEVVSFLENYGVTEVTTLKQITLKKDCLIIMDEFQKLKLNDKRYKDDLDDFIDFVYHNNVMIILASPNLREFNSIIGSKIEGWILKSLNIEDLVNGSQLKRVVDEYKGSLKVFKSLQINKSDILVINNEKETIVSLPYIKEVDTKIGNKDLFCVEKVEEIVKEKTQENGLKKVEKWSIDSIRWALPFNKKERWYDGR
jgi:hypothetical protein